MEVEKCRFILDSDSRCKKKKSKGSDFCWAHSFRVTSNIPSLILNLAIFFVSVGVSFAFFKYSDARSLEIAHLGNGEVVPKINSRSMIIVGNNRTWDGSGFISNDFRFGLDEDGKIAINGEIRTKEGEIIAHLIDSRLYVKPGFNYDVNSDFEALEVIGPDRKPVFQLIKNSKINEITINVYSYLKNNKVEVIDSMGLRQVPYGSPLAENKLVPIFVYPGYRNPGVRSDR